MKYLITFIALVSILPTNLMAAEYQYPVASQTYEKQEVRIVDKNTPESDKKFHYGFQVGFSSNGIKANDTKYLKDSNYNENESELEGFMLKTGAEYELNKTFSTRISLGSHGHSEGGPTERNTTVTDASGETFKDVDITIEYSNNEVGISPSLIHNMKFGSSWNIRNILSLGYARGTEKYIEFIKTDRNTWSPFSIHNYYTLESKRKYERRSVSYGIEVVLKKFVISAEVRHSEIKTKSINNTIVEDYGEDFDFGNDPYDFASYRDEVQDFIIGIGIRF